MRIITEILKTYKSRFDVYGQLTTDKLKTHYEKFYYIYTKFVQGDKIETSLNKVNTSQLELTKFRENHVDFLAQLNHIRFDLNKLSSQIYEAKRLENDIRYLELVRKERQLKNQEKLIQNDYYNAEKKEQSLKDNLAIARDELYITARIQGDYVKHLGAILAVSGFLFYIIKINYESSNVEKYTGEIRKDIIKLYDSITELKNKSSDSKSGSIYYLWHYTGRGFSYITSYFRSNNNSIRNEEIESNAGPGFMHYLGKYSGVNYLMSCVRSGTNNNTGTHQDRENRGYMFYVAKYTGISYVAWLVKGKKAND